MKSREFHRMESLKETIERIKMTKVQIRKDKNEGSLKNSTLKFVEYHNYHTIHWQTLPWYFNVIYIWTTLPWNNFIF